MSPGAVQDGGVVVSGTPGEQSWQELARNKTICHLCLYPSRQVQQHQGRSHTADLI